MRKSVMTKLAMTKTLLAMMLLALVASPAAIAQTGNQPSATPRQGPLPAPVGHRQPRADQVPSEKNLSDPNSAVNREDAALDRSIKSICRGC
jgi:hypothetical protein